MFTDSMCVYNKSQTKKLKTISTSQKSTKYIFIYTDVHLNDVKSIIDTNIDRHSCCYCFYY